MDVRSFFQSKLNFQTVEITGWLMLIDGELYLLEEKLCNNYKESMKIKVSERSIIYALCGAVLPLGGGESFICHRAKLIGYVSIDPTPEIKVENLYIQEVGQTDMFRVDISQSALDAATQRYEAELKRDFFKDMGDR